MKILLHAYNEIYKFQYRYIDVYYLAAITKRIRSS
jgi:hypothetical protein